MGALGDKFRPATSYLTVACMSGKRYFDLDAVRQPYSPNTNARVAKGVDAKERSGKSAERDGNWDSLAERDNDGAGAPPLDYWVIPTQPYKGSHYATYPTALVEKPIKAMCPVRVCRMCGEPSRRIVDTSYVDSNGDPAPKGEWKSGVSEGKGAHSLKTEVRTTTTTTTTGWTDCGHNDWRPGVVLDPFAGSGTTLEVVTGHGRDAIGVDLDERNAHLAQERVGGLLLTVEHFSTTNAEYPDTLMGNEAHGWTSEPTAPAQVAT